MTAQNLLEIVEYIRQSLDDVRELESARERYGYLRQTLDEVAWKLELKAKVDE